MGSSPDMIRIITPFTRVITPVTHEKSPSIGVITSF